MSNSTRIQTGLIALSIIRLRVTEANNLRHHSPDLSLQLQLQLQYTIHLVQNILVTIYERYGTVEISTRFYII